MDVVGSEIGQKMRVNIAVFTAFYNILVQKTIMQEIPEVHK